MENLREMFKGYTRYSTEEYKRIWDNALVVVDTNILLNLFRYSKETKEEVIKILNELKNRLFLPYQVAFEFFINKDKVIAGASADYDKASKCLYEYKQNLINEISNIKNSRLKCKADLIKIIENNNHEMMDLINKEKVKKLKDIENSELEEEIIELFNNVTECKLKEDEYLDVLDEGQRRFVNKIPPGYKDNEKESNGDYIIFYSIMKKAKSSKKDIIFVTDDVKEDWFYDVKGVKSGRKEILDEFYKNTNRLMLIYTADNFIKAYNNLRKNQTNEKVIAEIKTIQKDEKIFRDQFVILDSLKEKLNIHQIDLSMEEAQNILETFKDFIKKEIPSYLQSELMMYTSLLDECILEQRRDSYIYYANTLIDKLHKAFNMKEANKMDMLLYEYEHLLYRLKPNLSIKTYSRLRIKFNDIAINTMKCMRDLIFYAKDSANFLKINELFRKLIRDDNCNQKECIEKIKEELMKNINIIKSNNNCYF